MKYKIAIQKIVVCCVLSVITSAAFVSTPAFASYNYNPGYDGHVSTPTVAIYNNPGYDGRVSTPAYNYNNSGYYGHGSTPTVAIYNNPGYGRVSTPAYNYNNSGYYGHQYDNTNTWNTWNTWNTNNSWNDGNQGNNWNNWNNGNVWSRGNSDWHTWGPRDTDPVHYQNCNRLFAERTDTDPVHYQNCDNLLRYGRN